MMEATPSRGTTGEGGRPGRDLPRRARPRLSAALLCLVATGLLGACGDGAAPTRPGGISDDALPDLQPASIVLSDPHPYDDETITITGVVRNAGQVEAGGFTWTLHAGGDEIARGRVARLAAGEETSASAIRASEVGPFAAGDHEVTLTVDVEGQVREADEASNTLHRRLPVENPGYDIHVEFLSELTVEEETIFLEAAARWERIVTGDVEPNVVDLPAACGNPELGESVDDLRVFVTVGSIDGAGGTLARGGPCISRGPDGSSPSLPITGQMTIDESDFDALVAGGRIAPLILHELGHVMGIGTRWDDLELIADAGTNDPYFMGQRAGAAFDDAGGQAAYSGEGRVPVANTGGSATRDSHWRESVLLSELMTGFAEPRGVTQELSAITVGSLADLGYEVNFGSPEIDEFRVPGGSDLVAPDTGERKTPWDQVHTSPQYVVTEDGRIQRFR